MRVGRVRDAARVVLLAGLALVVAGCATAPAPGGTGAASGRPIRLVAAENFWGSIAAQLGGPYVQVTSLIDNPDADPHDYEPTPADARAMATADVVLVNGVGYDAWASRLAEADADPDQTVVTVGSVVGAVAGDNPHRWYAPADVDAVADEITATYRRVNPAHATDFDRLRQTFATTGTAAYRAVVADIRARFAGTPIGASESIVAMVAPALGLELVTPAGFLRAVSEGTEPTAADKATVDRQIATRAVAVYVYNSQNATPDVQQQIDAARAAGIPVTTVTETMVPADGTWQDWQARQLTALRDALATATGR